MNSFFHIFQFSIVYFEPDGDLKYKFNSKPKLVTVPDTEILQVRGFNCSSIIFNTICYLIDRKMCVQFKITCHTVHWCIYTVIRYTT